MARAPFHAHRAAIPRRVRGMAAFATRFVPRGEVVHFSHRNSQVSELASITTKASWLTREPLTLSFGALAGKKQEDNHSGDREPPIAPLGCQRAVRLFQFENIAARRTTTAIAAQGDTDSSLRPCPQPGQLTILVMSQCLRISVRSLHTLETPNTKQTLPEAAYIPAD
jgi:hypothetical protein